jgi:tetratricopeptide (TPR) repeat protein
MGMLSEIWDFLRKKKNLAVVCAIAAGGWAVFTYFHDEKRVSSDHGSIAIGGHANNSTIVVNNGLGRDELRELLQTVAAEKGVPEEPLRAVLQRLGEAEVPREDIPARLSAKADELIALQEQLARIGDNRPEYAELRRRALARIDAGDFAGARQALASARDLARQARTDAARDEAELLADEARIDRLNLDYRAAAENFSRAAALMAGIDPYEQWKYLLRQADELYDQGNEFGDNPALTEAIETYRWALSLISRQ